MSAIEEDWLIDFWTEATPNPIDYAPALTESTPWFNEPAPCSAAAEPAPTTAAAHKPTPTHESSPFLGLPKTSLNLPKHFFVPAMAALGP
ncbi:hypothetical protein DPX16_13079 [Anabarilius grahami]|uniref:Uncharacterized protein n=1 Tax=Anabarilius grahami TaxID=495550 RepID=A0A3N0XDR1_ANAGA|nr:hypothetical protein DPX16_13079 [Anabarilius grahami]